MAELPVGIPRRSFVRVAYAIMHAQRERHRDEMRQRLSAHMADLMPLLTQSVKLGPERLDAAAVAYLWAYISGLGEAWEQAMTEWTDCGEDELVATLREQFAIGRYNYSRIVRLVLGGEFVE